MTPQSEKLKQATTFFGEERMAKFENLVITESRKNKSFFGEKIRLTVMVILLIYTTVITHLYFSKQEAVSDQTIKNINSTTINNITNQIPLNTNNEPEVVIPANFAPTNLNNTIRLKVQKGENLTSITNKLIKSNKVKNTTENRQLVMSALKNINEIQEPGQIIKEGTTLFALSNKEIRQICKN